MDIGESQSSNEVSMQPTGSIAGDTPIQQNEPGGQAPNNAGDDTASFEGDRTFTGTGQDQDGTSLVYLDGVPFFAKRAPFPELEESGNFTGIDQPGGNVSIVYLNGIHMLAKRNPKPYRLPNFRCSHFPEINRSPESLAEDL